MEIGDQTSLLLEINLQLLATNLQLNSLFLKNTNNPSAISQGQVILSQISKWLSNLEKDERITLQLRSLILNLMESLNLLYINDEIEPISTNLDHESSVIPMSDQISTSDEANTDGQTNLNILSPISPNEDLSEVSNSSEILTPSPTSITSTLSPLSPENEVSKPQKSFFTRLDNSIDHWDYIDNINVFMGGYERFMHFLLPNLYFEVIKELHHYETSGDFSLLHLSIQQPSHQMRIIITKLLREAPGASLLRRIRRETGIKLELDTNLTVIEREHIKHIVKNYFITLTKYLDPDNPILLSIDTFFAKIESNVNQYSLGPVTIETRLVNVMRRVAEDFFNVFSTRLMNEPEKLTTTQKVIQLATIQMLTQLGNLILEESRFFKLLEDLKA